MKAATLNELKKELASLDADVVQALCMRLAKYKKENKELLTYLLFEAHNEDAYIDQVKEEVDDLFATLSHDNVYFLKKSLRKVLRIVNKQIKYFGKPETEITLRIYFCQKVKSAKVPLTKSTVLNNLYQQQLNKIQSVLAKLPEDLQYDYHQDIGKL